jgi:hypothetical protein
LCNILHYPVTSSLLGPNILLRILLSNTLRSNNSRSKFGLLFTVHEKEQKSGGGSNTHQISYRRGKMMDNFSGYEGCQAVFARPFGKGGGVK